MTPSAEAFAAVPAVLGADSPPVDIDWVRGLAQRHWGLGAESVEPMSGERDRNFRLPCENGHVLLKVSHPDESPLVADFQTGALRHVARVDPGLPVQRVVPTLAGAASVDADPGDGRPRVVRLFSYLPGLPLPEAPRSERQGLAIARMLGRLDLALHGFSHPAGRLALPWDIQRADAVRPLLGAIADEDRRALAGRALDRFEQTAKPVLPGLRRQPIHNDFNVYNLLVDPAAPERIVGVLDFGDIVEAPLIDDLAVAAAYQLGAGDDAFATLAPFVAAYHAVLPLQSREIDLLFTMMTARMVMVVAISGWRAARNPANAAYLLRNHAVSWARLAACDRIGDAAGTALLRSACEAVAPFAAADAVG